MTVALELVTDPHGLITRATPDFAALLAVEERWLLRKPLATFIARRDRNRFRTFLVALMRDGGCSRASFVLESRSGVEIGAVLAAERCDGVVAWVIEADADPPDPMLAAAPADGGRPKMFERLLARLPQGVIVVDRKLHVVYVNPAARRIVASGDDALRIGDPLPDPWPEFSLRALAASLFTPAPAAAPRVFDAGDRTFQFEGLTGVHLPTATLLLDDVTERERNRKAERQFIENAAHELRTPLAAILSVLDVLETGAKDIPDARDRFLAHIRAQSDRLTMLTNSLLMLARIQTGQEQPRLDLVRTRPLLEEVAAELSPRPSVEVEVDAPADLAVLADHDLLYEAVSNVATNAVKHTIAGTVCLTARDLGRTTEIEIRDTGRGMTREEQEHAFDRFYRSTTDARGFGLGLAIADEAVRATGGSITIHSRTGEGSRVRIALPSATIVS